MQSDAETYLLIPLMTGLYTTAKKYKSINIPLLDIWNCTYRKSNSD